jgi:hypothetical protein
MIRRRLAVLAAIVPVLAIGGVAWRFLTPEPTITEERARLIQSGMTESEVKAILGPAGDYTHGAVVTYARGGVGDDVTGYSSGTNWWGTQGVIQVQFSADGLVESANYYPANSVRRVDFWSALKAIRPLGIKGNRHGWVAAHW